MISLVTNLTKIIIMLWIDNPLISVQCLASESLFLSSNRARLLDLPLMTFIIALLASDSARDFDERFDGVPESLIRVCMRFEVTQIFNANFSSALNASQGVIWKADGNLIKYPLLWNFISNTIMLEYVWHFSFYPYLFDWCLKDRQGCHDLSYVWRYHSLWASAYITLRTGLHRMKWVRVHTSDQHSCSTYYVSSAYSTPFANREQRLTTYPGYVGLSCLNIGNSSELRLWSTYTGENEI